MVLSCATCRFWDPPLGAQVRGVGYCRRNAPPAQSCLPGAQADYVGRWPLTLAGDWCGQHQPAPVRQTMLKEK